MQFAATLRLARQSEMSAVDGIEGAAKKSNIHGERVLIGQSNLPLSI
jgi:hypothetical protein